MKSWMICGRSSVVARIVFTAAAALNTNVYCIWIFFPHVVCGATWVTLTSNLVGHHCRCSVVSATVCEVRHQNPLLPKRSHFFLGFWGTILLTRSLDHDSVVFSFRSTMETRNFRIHFTIWQSMTVRSMHSIRNSNRFECSEPCTGVESNGKHNHNNNGNKLNEIAKIVSSKPMAGICVLVIGDDFHICVWAYVVQPMCTHRQQIMRMKSMKINCDWLNFTWTSYMRRTRRHFIIITIIIKINRRHPNNKEWPIYGHL